MSAGVLAAVRERCDAWDDMHRRYFPDYDRRWRVAIDVVARATAGRAMPRVLDLGCGPGTLTRRLSQALPKARVVGIDADPLLIDMARLHPGPPLLSYHRAWVGSASTVVLLQDLAPFDAIVSSAFVHYFDAGRLARLHALCRRLLVPDGVLVTVERFANQDPVVDEGAMVGNPWHEWWETTYADPLFATYADRADRHLQATEPPPLTKESYLALLAEARFAERGFVAAGAGSTVVAARPCMRWVG